MRCKEAKRMELDEGEGRKEERKGWKEKRDTACKNKQDKGNRKRRNRMKKVRQSG